MDVLKSQHLSSHLFHGGLWEEFCDQRIEQLGVYQLFDSVFKLLIIIRMFFFERFHIASKDTKKLIIKKEMCIFVA